MRDPQPYEIYAVRYATASRRASDVFIGGDPHESPLPMDYFVWAARNDRHTVVIDTGFDAVAAEKRGREFLRPPADGLRLLGIDCDLVSDVIITHLHYDHAGNLQLFPNARFHLQDREMAFATGRHMGHPFFSHAYDLDAVLSMVRLVYGAHVQFHDGDAEIYPGLSVHRVGGHTHGLQVVRVWTRVGWVVLASDAAHYLANMESGRPFPIVADVMHMIEGWRRVKELASRPELIVPGHDPVVMQLYEPPAASLRGIAVRLDASPRGGPDGHVQG